MPQRLILHLCLVCITGLMCACKSQSSKLTSGDVLKPDQNTTSLSTQEHPGRLNYEKWCAKCHGSDGRGAHPLVDKTWGEGPSQNMMRMFVDGIPRAETALHKNAAWYRGLSLDTEVARYEFITDHELMEIHGYIVSVLARSEDVVTYKEFVTYACKQGVMSHELLPDDPDWAAMQSELEEARRTMSCDESQLTELKAEFVPSESMMKLGAQVYVANCAACHGMSGLGDGYAASALVPAPTDLTNASAMRHGSGEFDVFMVLLDGIEGTSMAPYQYLPQEELLALSTYVSQWTPEQTSDNAPSRHKSVADYCKAQKVAESVEQDPCARLGVPRGERRLQFELTR